MISPIILYDIPGNAPECKAWSPNTWKVRLALHYKGLPMKTQWVEYPDIEALYRKLGLQALETKDNGDPYYCLPIIHDPSTNTTISESFVIVQYLEKTYPNTPTLLPPGTLAFHAAFLSDWMVELQYPTFRIACSAVWKRLNTRSQRYYRTTREKDLGVKLEEVSSEEWWHAAERAWTKVDRWLQMNGNDGGLVMGSRTLINVVPTITVPNDSSTNSRANLYTSILEAQVNLLRLVYAFSLPILTSYKLSVVVVTTLIHQAALITQYRPGAACWYLGIGPRTQQTDRTSYQAAKHPPMSAPIVLYDITSRNALQTKAWSPNTWKVRFALNYKGLPVKTEWIEYPDIEALYHKLGIEATEKRQDESPYYCLPLIHDPSTNTIMCDSFSIVRYLEKTYPNTPTLLPKGTLALHKTFSLAFNKVHGSTFDLVVYPVWRILNERSQVFFRTTRERIIGPLEDVCDDASWENAEKAWSELDSWLKLNGEGLDNMVMGDRVCYADLQIASCLMWAKNSLDAESAEWKRICGWNGGKWKRYLDQFSKYEVIDN
ncbi:hypothetical protein NM688_g3391 [Phlebia brevispora]|uniref:Uncharacterized protein n=1 Tax=Phlebia brevispora TaxID=194682 RepID=A0ACC1T5Q5_9APHY|nr:hypothetical protein NM688_g3391 [Phlebia brevispora]